MAELYSNKLKINGSKEALERIMNEIAGSDGARIDLQRDVFGNNHESFCFAENTPDDRDTESHIHFSTYRNYPHEYIFTLSRYYPEIEFVLDVYSYMLIEIYRLVIVGGELKEYFTSSTSDDETWDIFEEVWTVNRNIKRTFLNL